MPHTLLVPDQTRARLEAYLASLKTGQPMGKRLARALANHHLAKLTAPELQDALLNTKVPQIFAESQVAGDGSDWNLTELSLLGDLSIAVPVTIFDDGRHSRPCTHPVPFAGTLVFTPGALLRNGRHLTPTDWPEVVKTGNQLDSEGYFHLYERRLLPVFQYVDAQAATHGTKAFITIPGLGCGQFAGPFRGQLGKALQVVLERLLTTHGEKFPNLRAVYYDPFDECSSSRQEIHGISFMVRPLRHANRPQLCQPKAYQDPGDDFSQCHLFSLVAWDHVSWPGNDFFAGSRCTDDGVKAAATDSMRALTGIEGHYDTSKAAYLPPPPYHTWAEVVENNDLRL